MKLRLIHKGLVLVGVPLLLAFVILGAMFELILQTDRLRAQDYERRREAETATKSMVVLHDVLMCVEHIVQHDPASTMLRLGTDLSTLKARLKGDLTTLKEIHDEAQTRPFDQEFGKTQHDFDNMVQDMLDDVRSLIANFRVNRLSLDSFTEFHRLRKELTIRVYSIAKSAYDITGNSLRFLEGSPERARTKFIQEVMVLGFGVLFSVFSGFVLARWFSSDVASRLRVVTENTVRMTRGEELNPPLGGTDEIATLDHGFHTMAEALREAIAREHALFENASDIMCVIDGQLRLTAVNPAFTRLLGLEKEEVIGKNLLQLVSADDADRSSEILLSTTTGAPAATFENKLRRKNGDELDLLWSVYWSQLDCALYAVAHDISERKKVERQKAEFLAMVSHDLRSPLSAIFGSFKLIVANALGQLPEAATAKVLAVTANVNRLLALVNDLLDIEKLEAGRLELVRKETGVGDLIKQAVDEIEPVAGEKQVTVSIDCRCGEFSLDGDRIIQVLLNLLSNAVKYSPQGGTVIVSAAQAGGVLEVSVQDQGRGIPEEFKDKVFERFKQLKASDERTGTGLGLPICKMIIETHGGTIGVDSKVGAGSRFWFKVPGQVRSEGGINAARTGAGSNENDAARSTGQGMTALGDLARRTGQGITALSDLARRTGQGIQTLGRSGEQTRRVVNSGARQTADEAVVLRRKKGKAGRLSSWFNDLSLWRKGVILVVVPVVFELVLAGSMFALLTQAFNEQQRELNQRLIAQYSADLLLAHFMLAFSMSLQGDVPSWNAFDAASKAIVDIEHRLLTLTAGNPRQHELVQGVIGEFQVVREFSDHAHLVVAAAGGPTHGVLGTAYSGRDKLIDLAAGATPLVQQMIDQANVRGDQSPAVLDKLRRGQGAVLLGGLVTSVLISVLSALMFSQGIASRLKVTEDNVRRLEKDQTLNQRLPGRDEVAHLDQFFHSMAEALNEARHKERAVFDNCQDVICTIGIDGTVSSVNNACEQLWGYSRVELLNRSILEVIVDAQTAARVFKDVAGKEAATEQESRIIRKNGSECDVLWSLSWSQSQQSLIAIAHDISQRKELERLKQEFLAMVSHDMRTPLSSISVTTEMLCSGAMGPLPQKVSQQLEVVVRNCDRLLTLINDLLDIEKLEAGQMQLAFETVDAAAILQRAAEALESLARERGINIVVQTQNELNVKADADRLVQVGVNLLSNAIKFSEPGSTVTLAARPASGFVEFAVSDTGRGVPESHVTAIFERFQQVEAADGKRRAGTGLGLPICKQIVERHGGQIGVVSTPGQGSTFYFRIPAATSAAAGNV